MGDLMKVRRAFTGSIAIALAGTVLYAIVHFESTVVAIQILFISLATFLFLIDGDE
jgi:hypothetical protein